MTGNSIALDTSRAFHVLNDISSVVTLLRAFRELCLPATVLGELRFGAMKSARPQANLVKLDALAARCRGLDVTATTADAYARVRLRLMKKGRPIAENDIRIAASCLEHGLPLATDDAHFDEVDGLQALRRP